MGVYFFQQGSAFRNYKNSNIISDKDICLIFINGYSIAQRPPSGHLLGSFGNVCYGLNYTTLSLERDLTEIKVVDKFHPKTDLSTNPKGEVPQPCFENSNESIVTGVIYFFNKPFAPNFNCFTQQPSMPQLLFNLNNRQATECIYNKYLTQLKLEEVLLPSKKNDGYRVLKLKDENAVGRCSMADATWNGSLLSQITTRIDL
jgi:hypothetical protein